MKDQTTTIEVLVKTRNLLMFMKHRMKMRKIDDVINYLIRRGKK